MIQVRQAMVLAAGLGRRMRPLTERTAKSLLPLGRRTLLDHTLDRLANAGVERVVVNAHWQAARVEAHLDARGAPPQVTVRHEPELLGTGGAIAAALHDGALLDSPFYVVNADSFWLDGPTPALTRLAAAFDPETLDGVLLVHRTFQIVGDVGFGDFVLDKWGLVRRREEREIVPYLYAGIQLVTPAAFAGFPHVLRDMTPVWDRAIAAARLRAVVHDGLWFHLSTPADLAEAESSLHAQALGGTR